MSQAPPGGRRTRGGLGPVGGGGAWRRYRCPVCGHRDQVVEPGGDEARVLCSHCGTELIVTFGRGREVAAARVAPEAPDEADTA